MTQKLRKTLIMVVMAALIICLMAASLTYTFTYGRYAGGKFDEESPYGDLIEFVGANQYTVRTPEELIQAIEDGYSNIKIADDAEEPFVIDTGVTDVSANLVLDLNGTNVIRNSRNPLLDVKEEVSVVLVYDSAASKEEAGSFYNPVGSNLQVSGGTLTVAVGNYISGPEDGEYNTKTESVSQVPLFARNKTDRADSTGYTPDSEVGALPDISTNKYFEKVDTGTTFDDTYIKPDTFLLYTIEKDCFVEDNTLYTNAEETEQTVVTGEALTVACNVASCDFYYYYPIGGTAGKAEAPQDYAVIYGYWDVKALAKGQYDESKEEYKSFYNSADLVWPYGAVRMVESDNAAQDDNAAQGECFARGGNFYNYFDTANTYGIYAESGSLVASGNVIFSTGGDGVCIRCEGSASLSIGGGTYSSEKGNTIEMVGGKMTVTKGTFTKDASAADTASTDNGSAIDIQGGTLTMTGSDDKTFTITGNYVNGVRVGDPTTSTVTETATIENAVFNFNKGEGSNSVAGVRSFGGTLTVRSSTFNISNGATSGKTITRAAGLSTQGGTVTATACIFNFAQENATVFPTASAGISSLGGTVTAKDSTFTIPGNNNYGIYSSITSGVTGENQYDTKAENCTFKLTGNSNHGIYAAGGKTLASGGTITLIGSGQNSDNFGIYSQSGTTTAEGCTITITGTYSAGALSYDGTINLKDNTVIKVTESGVSTGDNTLLTSSAVSSEASTSGDHPINMNGNVTIESDGLGITARGNINVQSGKTTITTERATGIYVQGGILTVLERAVVEVNSEIDSTCSWVVPPEHTDDESLQTNIYNGVFVNGGSLVSEGTLNVTFTGVQNESKYDIDTLLETYDITLPTIGEDGIGSTTETFWNDDDSKWNSFYNAYRELSTPSFQEVQQAVSYAVRVEAGGSANTTVKIASGNITNSVGGGVLVNGGKVTLGETDLKIHAEGNETIDKTYIYTFTRNTGEAYHDWWWRDYYEYTIEVRSAMYFAEIDAPAQNWAYRENQTGGDAVRVEGGELTIVGGTYTSAQGNGIVAVGGKTTINGGTFNGSDNYKVKDGNGLVVPAGPAASYAFKVYGGEITVNAGMFGDPDSASGASGGFVMGTSADAPGTAYINGGTFAVSNGNAGGQAGFGVYRYANVTFGQEGITGDIQVTGLAAGLVLERTPGDSGTTVTINRGTFSSTRTESGTSSDGVWYGNGTSKLNIKGGEFTGAGRSGIQLDENPSNNVRITGGTFVANQGYPISGYFNQVVPSGYGIISGSNSWHGSCTIG